ncbi:MAG: hypothetical protein MJ218_02180 [Opitutales bacterium]|nr:hypothetical protein [Opitutales bacterium]
MGIETNPQAIHSQIELTQPNENVNDNSISVSQQAIVKNINLATKSLANMHEAGKAHSVSITDKTQGKGILGRINQVFQNIVHNLKHLFSTQSGIVKSLNQSVTDLTNATDQIMYSYKDISKDQQQTLVNNLANTFVKTANTLQQIIGTDLPLNDIAEYCNDLVWSNNEPDPEKEALTQALNLANKPVNKAIVDCLCSMTRLQLAIDLAARSETRSSSAIDNNVQNQSVEKQQPISFKFESDEESFIDDIDYHPLTDRELEASIQTGMKTLRTYMPKFQPNAAISDILTQDESSPEEICQQLSIDTNSLNPDQVKDVNNQIEELQHNLGIQALRNDPDVIQLDKDE